MVKRFVQLIASGLCVIALSAAARADLVTFEVTGAVTAFDDFAGGSGLGWTIPIGAPFGGRYTFDSETPDALPDFPEIAQYYDGIVSSRFSIGSAITVDTGVSSRMAVVNDLDDLDAYLDGYSVHETTLSFRGFPVRLNLAFTDYDHDVFDTDELPLTPPPLDEFESVLWTMGTENGDFVVIGSISSLILVPEPSSLMVLTIGVAFARMRWRI